MKRFLFIRCKYFTVLAFVGCCLTFMFSSSGNDEKLYRNRIASLTRMVSDMQSLLSRTGLSAVVGMEVVIETTAKIDFLLVATEFDSLDYRDSYIAPNIRAAIGKENCVIESETSGADIQVVDLYRNMDIASAQSGHWMDKAINWTWDSESFKQRKLEVIMMPHSHNDPGWLKTFEQYFEQDTNGILNNIVNFLEQKETRKFSWAEISFFSMWWERANDNQRARMKALVASGRVEFITAGWVMEDEANTYLYAMVDQMIEGNHFIKDHLGAKAKSAWSIDPFGQSSTVAYLRKRMGFSNMVIQRTHYLVKKYLASKKNLEFSWRQNWDPRGDNDMFTHMMTFSSYCTLDQCGPDKPTCCQFDFARMASGQTWGCQGNKPVVVTPYNVAERSAKLVDQFKKKSTIYRSNVILVAVGQDFSFRTVGEARHVFENNEMIMDFVNSHPEFNTHIKWGTLSDYFELAHSRLRPSDIPHLSGDFFTYSDRNDDYWSGYFTSRAFFKKLDRILESRLRSAEIIFSMANMFVQSDNNAVANLWEGLATELMGKLTVARRHLGLFQHHDGITGTSRDPVVIDYGKKLFQALAFASEVITQSGQYLLLSGDPLYVSKHAPKTLEAFVIDESRTAPESIEGIHFVPMKNTKAGKMKEVVFYNSLGFQRQQIVSVLVDSPNVEVQCHKGFNVHAQIAPKWMAETSSWTIELDPNLYELWFTINTKPLSLTRYFIVARKKPARKATSISTLYAMNVVKEVGEKFPASGFQIENTEPKEFKLSNYHYILSFGENGLLKSIKDRNTERVINVGLSFAAYHVNRGGAYLFYPGGPPKPLPSLAPPVVVEKGHLFSRVTVMFDNVMHSIRIMNSPGLDGYSIAVSNLVDLRKTSNRELTMRIDATDLMKMDDGEVKKTFYTDLNGFQMQARHYHSQLPLQASFYPMPSQMIINGVKGSARVTLHSAQSAGAGITPEGFIDIMLDRRLMQDDGRGVQQGVKDNKLTPNDFWLVPEFFDNSLGTARDASDYAIKPTVMSQQANLALNNPLIALLPADDSKQVNEGHSGKVPSPGGFQGQAKSYLPCDVHLLNLRTMNLEEKEALLILHRLGHSCRVASSGNLVPTNCSLNNGIIDLTNVTKDLFKFTEYSLNGIHNLSEAHQKTIQINPFEINTYLMQLDKK